ncbi:MAG: ATP-binding protein, partial [Vicinamibacterales bacterium]
MGETRVDLQHLLEDLRDAYTGSLEDTILTEILANALDSGAGAILIATNPSEATLTVVDDGRGMQRRQLSRYHDVAASTKARGEGIGFAGVGIKLGLLASREVVTETRRGATHVATRWHLGSRHRAPWKWIPPPNLTATRGTAVRLALTNPLSPLLDAGYLEEAIRRHFAPLLDASFAPILARHYPQGVMFAVDGQRVIAAPIDAREAVPVEIRLGRRRTPSAVGYLALHDRPLADDHSGIAISTYGKIIKRGWEWLGLTPAIPDRVSGVVEIPDLAACLTLNKSDVFRTGPRAASYLAYRKALQEVVSRQLAAWGDSRETAEARPRTQRLERDLQRVLDDLTEDFPLLSSLVERRAGGQKRLPLPGRGDEIVSGTLFARLNEAVGEDASTNRGREEPREEEEPGNVGTPTEPSPEPPAPSQPEGDGSGRSTVPDEPPVGAFGTVHGRRRPARSTLDLRFEPRSDDPELGRLIESAIWINEAHPAYVRAVESRSLGYHIALTVALALAPLAVGAADEHGFLTQFLAHWGSSD